MPYSFDEAFEATRSRDYVMRATLVITQGDGRTAVSETGLLWPPFSGDRALTNLVAHPSSVAGFITRFNDRPAFDGSQLGRLPFTGSADNIGVEIRDQGGNSYSAQIRLYSWGGGGYSLQMSQPGQAKLLMGWGEPIGFGEPQALHVVSFNQLIENVIL